MMTLIQHHDWLSLIEISGPFLAVPVLKEAFPQGLEELDGTKRKHLRQAYEEWREALEVEDAQFAELHVAWIDEVLSRGLELDEDGKGDVLKRADWCAANVQASLPEHGVTLSPDFAVIDAQRGSKPLLLIKTYAQDIDLDATLKQDGWVVTPADRMVQLCRSLGCRLGMLTNGERWMLVDAPVGAVTTVASWYARIWNQEPITLQAFVHLLGIRRFFVDESEQLPALFDRSLKFHDEVTDALGEQVRRAVEVLIQTLDKADQDRNRELLHDVQEPELYEAALTVMMRLVFLLSAEERGLLLMGDERYEANYALSTLRMQLRKESEEILERRWDAWSRLLAIFRAVFGGIKHENLRLPALGGSLFDPDRFPFLEGRAKGSSWRSDTAKPLPIDNRTVLLLLEAIQQFQGRTLSYRALDVEQIGYVYEGLLERTVKRTDEVTLELDATKSAKTPWVKLAELDSARLDGAARLAELLQERSGSSAGRVRNDLAKPVDDTLADRLLTACQGDTKLRDRVKPYAHLLRTDPWGYPLVYPAGAFIVTTGSDRRETGTHYTPKSLTEAIVTETLTPVAYVGPADGTPREHWTLKSPSELLDLKICDPAMGSGAFLVQACRWLADRLVEAWSQVEAFGKTVSVDGEVLEAEDAKEPLPRDSEARTLIARRLIAERCIYGVDLNPLAVELAKLSIWMVTLAKGRPFGFLDHNLRCGDSLLGIHRLDQLTELSITPTGKGQQHLFGQNIERAVHEAIELRQLLREVPIRDIRDVEAMAQMDADTRRMLEVPERIADAFISHVFEFGVNGSAIESATILLADLADQSLEGDIDSLHSLSRTAQRVFSGNLPFCSQALRPFHWILEFPEVFIRDEAGFDAVIGNPPFMGGKKIGIALGGGYVKYLSIGRNNVKGSSDLCADFYLRASKITKKRGCFGLIGSNSIAQGGSREVGIGQLADAGHSIFSAISSCPWPGQAGVDISLVYIFSGEWAGSRALNGELVTYIGSYLTPLRIDQQPSQLDSALYGAKGTIVHGEGFVLTEDKVKDFLLQEPKAKELIKRYLDARDFMSDVNQEASRWVIDFGDRSENEARQYPYLFSHIEKTVKPHRNSITGRLDEKCFWKHWNRRADLYQKIKPLDRVIVCPEVSKHLCFAFSSPEVLFSHRVAVIPDSRYSILALLQSSFQIEWAWYFSATMRNAGISYSIKDCLSNFPIPSNLSSLESIGQEFHVLRKDICLSRGIGLTELTNLINNSAVNDHDISNFRKFLVDLDWSVLKAFDFSGIELAHEFVKTSQGVRFAVGTNSRHEIIETLVELNLSVSQESIIPKADDQSNSAYQHVVASKTSSRKETKQKPLGLFGLEG